MNMMHARLEAASSSRPSSSSNHHEVIVIDSSPERDADKEEGCCTKYVQLFTSISCYC